INNIKNKSLFKSDIKVNSNDKIITLSTCSYEFDDARTVVHAKLLNNKK
ncbi:sortase, partial [Paraclostridium sordellii]